LFGFINIYKPKGWTSFDVVAKLRRLTGIKQIGHTGTLDPFATGVLPVCIGKATKLIEYLPDDKEYIATVQFGANTDTYDLEGEITQKFDTRITAKEVEAALKSFDGEIEQIPPIYSAIKVNGKKLYDYARKGQEVEIKPRRVNIYEIKLQDFDEEKQAAVIKVACSKGTYIRSIAYDLGKILHSGGHLIALERTKAGSFTIENTVKLENLTRENIVQKIINPIEILPKEKYILSEEEKERVCHGQSLKIQNSLLTPVVFFVYSDKILGVGQVDGQRILVKKVFAV